MLMLLFDGSVSLKGGADPSAQHPFMRSAAMRQYFWLPAPLLLLVYSVLAGPVCMVVYVFLNTAIHHNGRKTT